MEGMKAFQGVPCEGIPLQLYPPTCRLSSWKEQPTLSDTPVKRTDRDLDQIHSWTTLGENGHDDCHLEDRLQTGFISWAKPVKIVTDLNASIIGSRPYSAFIGQLEAQGNENFHHHSCLRV